MADFKPIFKGFANTMDELTELYYGEALKLMSKADDPVLTSTTGFRNVILGAQLFYQVALCDSFMGAVGMKPWQKSGYRLATAKASVSIGQTQGGAIPYTVKPTVDTLELTPKIVAQLTEQSTIQSHLKGKDDVLPWEELIDAINQEFRNNLDAGLLTDNDTLASTNVESLDRVIGSYSELTGCGQTAGDLDIYGKDRDAGATVYDAYVDHGSNTDRALTLSMIDSMFAGVRPYWKMPSSVDNKFMLTGYDTGMVLQQLIQTQVRYGAGASDRVEFTVNGVKTLKGVDGGVPVSAYNEVPIILDANVKQDTKSRVYMVDQDFMHLGVLTPPQYLESEDYLAIGKWSKVGGFMAEMELVCNKFKAQGKIRDLL